jgi:hypothetical protein
VKHAASPTGLRCRILTGVSSCPKPRYTPFLNIDFRMSMAFSGVSNSIPNGVVRRSHRKQKECVSLW